MSEDFIDVLALQLREAGARQRRRGPTARTIAATRAAVSDHALAPALATLVAAAILVAAVYAVTHLRPEPAAPPAPKVLTRFSPAAGLGQMAVGFGSVWLDDTNRNQLLRMDPHSHHVMERIPVRGDAAVTIGDDAVWVLESPGGGFTRAGPLLRIDPRTDRVVARIPLRTRSGERFLGWDVRSGPGGMWVIGPRGALLIDTQTNRIARTIDIGSRYEVSDAELSGSDLWILVNDGRMLRYDALTGARKGSADVPVTGDLTRSGGAVYLLNDTDVARLDPASGRLLWRWSRQVSAPSSGLATAAHGLLWVPTRVPGHPGLRIVGLHPETGRVIAKTPTVQEFDATSLVRVGSDLWMATNSGHVLVIRL
jgi:PQQ-like domain